MQQSAFSGSAEARFQRASPKQLDPAGEGDRKAGNFLAGLLRKARREPASGDQEGDRLQLPQVRTVQLSPLRPEGGIAGSTIEERGEFMNVMDDPLADKKIAQNMQWLLGGIVSTVRSAASRCLRGFSVGTAMEPASGRASRGW